MSKSPSENKRPDYSMQLADNRRVHLFIRLSGLLYIRVKAMREQVLIPEFLGEQKGQKRPKLL